MMLIPMMIQKVDEIDDLDKTDVGDEFHFRQMKSDEIHERDKFQNN